MKKKQLISIIITGVVIMAVGVTGIISNVLANHFLKSSTKSFSSSFEKFVEGELDSEVILPDDEFIGVLNIVGEIGASSNTLVYGSSYNHSLYINYIEQMKMSKYNQGIFLYVDSPGGAVYQSD